MNDELEDRLRRTYRTVADRTESGEDERSVELRPVVADSGAAPKWARIGMVAAVVLLLVGGLGVLATNRPESSSDSGSAHVLPTWIPTAASGGSQLALTSIASNEDADVLTYATEALAITISVFRTSIDKFEGDRVEVRGGQTATVNGDEAAGRLLWIGPKGHTVVVEWKGEMSNGLESAIALVDGLLLVDESTWNAATEFGGFGGFGDDRPTFRGSIGSVWIDLSGDLQSGLQLFIGGNGFRESSIEPGKCIRAFVRADDDMALVAVSRFPTGTATVTWPDGVEETTELVPFVEGSALGVGVFERRDLDLASLPDIVCEAAR